MIVAKSDYIETQNKCSLLLKHYSHSRIDKYYMLLKYSWHRKDFTFPNQIGLNPDFTYLSFYLEN